jgi:hypothetical protein
MDNVVIRPIRLFNIYGTQFGSGYAGNVWDVDGISPAIMTMQGGGREPMIVVYEEKDNNTSQHR